MTSNKFFFRISIQVIIVFTTVILVSFIPDYFHSQMGDTLCNGRVLNLTTMQYEYYWHNGHEHKDMEWHWGYRHWLFFIMGITLFVIQIFRIVHLINNTKIENK